MKYNSNEKWLKALSGARFLKINIISYHDLTCRIMICGKFDAVETNSTSWYHTSIQKIAIGLEITLVSYLFEER